MTKEKSKKWWISQTGYPMVDYSLKGKTTHLRVHRLVAEAFLPNPDNKPVVNHKDGNKQNCLLSNLEWATHSENSIHAFKTGLNTMINEPRGVIAYDGKTGEMAYEFNSLKEANKALGVHASNILKVIKGQRPHTGGYVWKYKEDKHRD